MNFFRTELGESRKNVIRIALDMIINLAGTGISLAILNLVVYPIVARINGAELYGHMQSSMAMVYLVSGTLGSALCSARLVQNYEYNSKQLTGDFNILFLRSILFGSFIISLVLFFYSNNTQLIDLILIVLIGLFNCAANYYLVGFRLEVNYKAIFVCKLIGCVGYLVGFLLFYYFHKWQPIFIMSLLFETLYCIVKASIFKEPYCKTFLFYKTLKIYVSLGGAAFLSKILTYIDKVMLYPLLGGEAVTIYYVASIFGKIIIMTIEPITNVVLSYLSKRKNVSKNLWKKVLLLSFFSCTGMFLLCYYVSGPIIKLLYPQWFEIAIKYVPVCTFCLTVSAFNSLIFPFALKTFESYKQIIINGLGVLIYSILFLLLYKTYGIYGCCYALLTSYISKFIMTMFFCSRSFESNVK